MFTARRSRFALFTVVASCVAVAATAPGACAAAQRYASPTGSGGDCSSVKPCSIVQAVNFAGAGDEVIVPPGSYGATTALNDPAPITIHGVAGQPRPRLSLVGAGAISLEGSTLRYIDIQQADQLPPVVQGFGAKLDQVVLRGGFSASCAASLQNSTVRNSLVIAQSLYGSAVCAGASQTHNHSILRNVTALAHDGIAIDAYATDATASVVVDVINTIAKTDPAGAGLEVRGDVVGASAILNVTHTNYKNYLHSGAGAVYNDGGGNQPFAPSFVNAAGGDYRQKAGSATIDAGHYDPMNGLYDLDGELRNVGSPDIGADEFVAAPTAATGPASAVTDQAATLAATVNSKGSPTSYHFEYGTTAAYGSSTSDTDAGSGMNDVAASAGVGGLAPAITYHYRVVASNAAGAVNGADQTFTTAPAGSGTPSPTAPGGFGGVKLMSTRLTLKGGFVVVKLSCPAGTAGRCAGVTKLSARRKRTGSRAAATVKLGRTRFSIAAGGRAKLKVRVSRPGRRLFAHTRRLRGRAATAAHDATGVSKTNSSRVTIRKGTR